MNWAILGLGKIAHKFASDLKNVKGATLFAVASTNHERAISFAKQYNVPNFFDNYESLLGFSGIDVIYIATTHPTHAELTLKCLKAGIPVLCEKPFAMNAEEARKMIVTARREGVFLMEAIWTRFIPLFSKALDLIESDEIGEVLTIKADFGFKATPFDADSRIHNPKLGAGSLLDIGIYPIFLSQILLGRPEKILAHATLNELGADENCAMIFQYLDKKIAMLHSSILMTTPTDAYIFGTKGTIYLHTRFHHASKMTLSRYGKPDEIIEMPNEGHGYGYEAAHVMDCIEQGLSESPLLPLDFSLELTEILDWVRAECGILY
jgi:predicted dehydrogenase